MTPTPTNTPTPLPPTPTPYSYTGTDLDNWFTRYSDEYHIDRNVLHNIAQCESGFNSTSHNVQNDYGGMYQFSVSTWISARTAMGADPNQDLRFNPEEAIKTAAFKISRGGAGAWPNCL
ncbi:transglycosylase family protein [Candidatus Roizmanbacteria bacterium]|nr:transglycosylase family protein [Candidatus Roizmanbacteria bacterium]